MNHKEQQGFLTVAINSDSVDYLELAYTQALNVKCTQKIKSFAVVVDKHTHNCVKDKHRAVFDYIIQVPESTTGPYGIEPEVFWLTPFKETVKLESDLLFTRSIDHWWNTFRLRDIVLSTGCRNYQQELSLVRKYRKFFDDNDLPDVYNGLMYFRFTKTARDFFTTAKNIYANWTTVGDILLNCRDDIPTTDVVYAIAARLVGQEQCTLPSADFVNFVHLKPAINRFDEDLAVREVFVTEFDQGMIRINNINQYHPLHYYDKTFVTKEMIEYYEQRSMA